MAGKPYRHHVRALANTESSSSADVVAAPDSFKGTHPATEVAAAIARGGRAAGATARELPVADGGEGTMDALLAAHRGELRDATATDPLGRQVVASFALLGDGSAIVEVAAASGLPLVAPAERDAWRASSRGTGELVAAAARAGADPILVAAGGSATTDGGEGALGVLDDAGLRARLVVLCDVRTAFEDAARVFGPQKGADAPTVARLAARLDALAAGAPRDPRGVPMSGAAGGLAGGLWAWLNAELAAGAPYVLDAVGFDGAAAAAALVVTGEGRLDASTLEGKAVAEVASRCRARGLPCHAIVGQAAISEADVRALGIASVSEASTLREVEVAARRLATGLPDR
jgi:glycerate 2-kinase